MAIPASQTSLSKLEPILLLAAGATGGGAAQLITQATSAPGCYVFAELLEKKGIADLANSPTHSSSHRLLEIFSFGLLSDYISSASTLPTLSPQQLTKLKHLTLVSLSARSSSLDYSLLLKELDMKGNVRALEELIIDAMYAGILSGRLNQMEEKLEIMGVMGRDVKGGVEIEEIVEKLRQWSSSSSNALSLLQARIQAIEMAQKATLQQRKTHETALVKSLKIVQNKNNASNNNSNNGSYDREIGAGGGSRDLMGRSGGEGSGTVGNPRGGGERELRSKDSNSSMKNATAESDTMDWEEGKGGGGKKKAGSHASTGPLRSKRSRGKDA